MLIQNDMGEFVEPPEHPKHLKLRSEAEKLAEQVKALEERNAWLAEHYQEVVHENAELNAKVYRLERELKYR